MRYDVTLQRGPSLAGYIHKMMHIYIYIYIHISNEPNFIYVRKCVCRHPAKHNKGIEATWLGRVQHFLISYLHVYVFLPYCIISSTATMFLCFIPWNLNVCIHAVCIIMCFIRDDLINKHNQLININFTAHFFFILNWNDQEYHQNIDQTRLPWVQRGQHGNSLYIVYNICIHYLNGANTCPMIEDQICCYTRVVFC